MDEQGQTFYGKVTKPDFVSYSWIDQIGRFQILEMKFQFAKWSYLDPKIVYYALIVKIFYIVNVFFKWVGGDICQLAVNAWCVYTYQL